MEQAHIEDDMRAKAALVNEAVLAASITAARRRGRDTSGVREAWEHFERAVDSGDERRRQGAFRSAKRRMRRGLGPRLASDWPMASVGAAWALLALLTWDQATTDGPYTIRDRDILAGPWRTVASLPSR